MATSDTHHDRDEFSEWVNRPENEADSRRNGPWGGHGEPPSTRHARTDCGWMQVCRSCFAIGLRGRASPAHDCGILSGESCSAAAVPT